MVIELYTLKANFQELIKKDLNNFIWQEMFSKMKTFQGERKAVGRGGMQMAWKYVESVDPRLGLDQRKPDSQRQMFTSNRLQN